MYQSSGNNIKSSPKLIQKLNDAIQIINECFELKEVYIFGSFAKGTEQKGDAVDLFVIANTEIPFIERMEIINDLFGQGHIRAEVIVYTPDEFKIKMDMEDSFIAEIMEYGIKIYPTDDRLE